MSHLMTCGDAPIAHGQTWLFQPLPVSTVPNTGRNQSDSGYRGLDEEEDPECDYAGENAALHLYRKKKKG